LFAGISKFFNVYPLLFSGSVYVRLFTRFTQEIFSALITLIYIVETVLKLISVYNRHPLLAVYPPELVANTTSLYNNSTILESNLLKPSNDTNPRNQPNTALFCTMLTLGTFVLAFFLKKFRNSHFLGRNARRALGDFGVPISITLFVLLDYMIPEVYTDKLSVPEGISPSDTEKRGWVIPLGPVPIWLPFLAGIPALLVYILIFMVSKNK
jgi:HCO3- transporter family